MFKRLLDSLRGKKNAPKVRTQGGADAAAASSPFTAAPDRAKPAKGAAADADAKSEAQRRFEERKSDGSIADQLKQGATPEEICGLRDGMTPAEMRVHLANLYRRYNHAASSFDNTIRDEAERMLDAIAEMREKYLAAYEK
ncbi:MAG: hypothetical protein R3F11_21115 [Verrucomicrobiales bacterium]